MFFVDGKMCCYIYVFCDWDVGVGIVSEKEFDIVFMVFLCRDQNGRGIVSVKFSLFFVFLVFKCVYSICIENELFNIIK